MKNLRFWQKTYLLTLLLFLVALYGGIFFIGWQSQRQTMDNEVKKSKSEQHFISQNLTRDLLAIKSNIHLRIPALIHSYSEYYLQNNVLLEVMDGKKIVYSTLPEYSGERVELLTKPGKQHWVTRTIKGEQYLYIASTLEGELNEYTITTAHSLHSLTEAWRQMRIIFAIGCVSVSTILAVSLFFVLRSLSKPLEKLALVADEFAGGNLSVRAKKKGNDEIGNLADSFNHMAEAAQNNIAEIKKTAAQNERMAANLSHEIRTPLTAIQGYAEYMQIAELTPEEQDHSLSYIIKESKRLQKISQRMLQLYAMQHNQIEKQPLILSNIVKQVLFTTAPNAAQKQVLVHAQPIPPVKILGDDVLLESLVTNLIDNAIKACSPGGILTVSSRIGPQSIKLQIEDNGCGMGAEELKNLGEPLYRSDKARSREEGGAGLGVALCYQIAHLHSAELCYSSELNKGTIANVKFTTL